MCAPSIQSESGRRSRGLSSESRRPEVKVGRAVRGRKPDPRYSPALRNGGSGDHYKLRIAEESSPEAEPGSQCNAHFFCGRGDLLGGPDGDTVWCWHPDSVGDESEPYFGNKGGQIPDDRQRPRRGSAPPDQVVKGCVSRELEPGVRRPTVRATWLEQRWKPGCGYDLPPRSVILIAQRAATTANALGR